MSQLPAPVRARVVALVARTLPEVSGLPAPLQAVASFAPAQRARMGNRRSSRALPTTTCGVGSRSPFPDRTRRRGPT